MEVKKSYPGVTKLTVAGRMDDANFHKCASMLKQLSGGTVEIECLEFFETQWEEFLRKISSQNKGQFYEHKVSPLVYANDCEYIGDSETFIRYSLLKFQICAKDSQEVYETCAANAIRERINHSMSSKYAFITFDVQGQQTQVVFELFHQIAPKTSDNFFGLCKQFQNKEKEVIGYQQTDVHRIVKGMYIQMGKIKTKEPETPTSIYGGEFADESFHVKHTEVGLMGMCKRSGLQHTNMSQFYVTTGAPLSYLDGQNVVFGRVIQGMSAIRAIEQLETVNERPSESVKIVKTGAYKME